MVYKIVEDPFNKDHLMLLSTDWGLQESFDRGATFRFCKEGIAQSWQNTAYDLAFNKNKEGVVYSIWSEPGVTSIHWIPSTEDSHIRLTEENTGIPVILRDCRRIACR